MSWFQQSSNSNLWTFIVSEGKKKSKKWESVKGTLFRWESAWFSTEKTLLNIYRCNSVSFSQFNDKCDSINLDNSINRKSIGVVLGVEPWHMTESEDGQWQPTLSDITLVKFTTMATFFVKAGLIRWQHRCFAKEKRPKTTFNLFWAEGSKGSKKGSSEEMHKTWKKTFSTLGNIFLRQIALCKAAKVVKTKSNRY